jgi:hypothetical protein
MNKNNYKDVEMFIENISTSFDYDYGDFMRSANLYLYQLRSALEPILNSKIERKLQEMQSYIQFHPNWDVDSTRDRVIRDATQISDLLLGLDDDLYHPGVAREKNVSA